MSELTFEYVPSQPNHYAGHSWTSTSWDQLGIVSSDSRFVIEYPGPEPPNNFGDSGDYMNDGWSISCARNWRDAASFSDWQVTVGVLWFDMTWMASTMYVDQAWLRCKVDGQQPVGEQNNFDGYSLTGAWYHDSQMQPEPYVVDTPNYSRDFVGEPAWEPIPNEDIPQRVGGAPGDAQDMEIPLINVNEHLNYGGYVGIRFWMGTNEVPNGWNNLRMMTRYRVNPPDPEFDPVLVLGLTCTDPDDSGSGDSSGGIFDQGFDDSDLLRDRLPANSIEAMLYQHPQSVSRLKAKVRQNESE